MNNNQRIRILRASAGAIFGLGLGFTELWGVGLSEARAQDNSTSDTLVIPDITIIGVSPIQGTGVPKEQIPSNTQSISRDTIERLQPQSLTDLLDQTIGSAVALDLQNNPYQQSLSYRGFTASPLLGDPQGIAVYQNGIRINEPFGDVVQWDLVPDVAINRVDIVNANPVFGLNALGGAITLGLQDGFKFQGLQAEGSGGYFGRGDGSLQFGHATETMGVYVAGEFGRDGGWRNDSPSEVRRLYSDLAFQNDATAIGISFALADNDLIGNGTAPVELMEQNRRANFTTPDQTLNEMYLISGRGDHQITDSVSIQANAYFRRLMRTTLNGDEVEAEECALGGAEIATLQGLGLVGSGLNALGNGAAVLAAPNDFICEEGEDDEMELLLDQKGNAIESFTETYGAENTSSTQTSGFGFSLQATHEDEIFERENLFVFGGSVDIGRTAFHSESGLGFLHLDRSVSGGPNDPLNTAKFEYEDGGGAGAIARGEVGPVRVVAKNEYYGLFASDTFAINENIHVTISGRYNIARIELIDELDSYFPRTSTLNGSHKFQRFNPAVGATYAIPEFGTTFYAGYSEANRAPSPAELSCADPDAPCRLPNSFIADPPLKQVVSRTYEVGVRGRIPSNWLGGSNSVNWNLGYFQSTNDDDIIFVSAGVGLGTGFFQNVDSTKRQGIEVGLNGISGPMRWLVNYSYIEAKFGNSFLVSSPNHPLAVANQIQVKDGDFIPGIPQHSAKIALDYELLPGFFVGGNIVATSGVYLRGDEANLLERTDPYAVLNLRSSYELNNWIEIFGWIENVLNTDYETFGVLGETGNEVPIHELPGGITNPRFLSAGQPFGAFLGVRIRLN